MNQTANLWASPVASHSCAFGFLWQLFGGNLFVLKNTAQPHG